MNVMTRNNEIKYKSGRSRKFVKQVDQPLRIAGNDVVLLNGNSLVPKDRKLLQ